MARLRYTHTDIKHKNAQFVPGSDRVKLVDYGNCTHDSEPRHWPIHTKQSAVELWERSAGCWTSSTSHLQKGVLEVEFLGP